MKKLITSLLGILLVLGLLIPVSIFAYGTELTSPFFDINYYCSKVPKSNVGALNSSYGTSDKIGNPSAIGGGILGVNFKIKLNGNNVAGKKLYYHIIHNDVSTITGEEGEKTTDSNGYIYISTLAPTISENGGTSSTRTLRISGAEPLDSDVTLSVEVTTDGQFTPCNLTVSPGGGATANLVYNGSTHDPLKDIDLNLNMPISIKYYENNGSLANENKDFRLVVSFTKTEGILNSSYSFPYSQTIHYSGSPVSLNIPINIKAPGNYFFDLKLYYEENGVEKYKEIDKNIFVSQIKDDYSNLGKNYYVNYSDSTDLSVDFNVYKPKVTPKPETKPDPEPQPQPEPEPQKPTTVYVSKISLNPSNVSLTEGDKRYISASISPSNATTKGITWSSSNHNVAKVVNNYIETYAAGTAYITATAADGSGVTGTCVVTVKSKAPTIVYPSSINLNFAGVTVKVGNHFKVNATVEPADATDKKVTWSSQNTRIADVVDGTITAKAAGTTTVIAKTSNGKEAHCFVTVPEPEKVETRIPVTGINLSKPSHSLNVGDSIILDAVVLPNHPEDRSKSATVQDVIWESSRPEVAVVGGSGKVDAKKEGSAIITATSLDNKNISAKCTITVIDNSQKNVKVSSVSLKPNSATIKVGESLTIVQKVLPENAENKTVTWFTTNDRVATVSNIGVVTPLKAGTCDIVVRTNDGGYTAKCALAVTANEEVIAQPSQDAEPDEDEEVVEPTTPDPEPTDPTPSDPTPSNPTPSTPTTKAIGVSYETHIENIGWGTVGYNGSDSGTTGQSLRLEGIKINVAGDENLGIAYRTHVQDIGWMSYVSNGAMSGTEGQAKRLEAIQIQLTGSDKNLYDVYYRVHAQDVGWMNWAKNGNSAGTAGFSRRLEAIEIKVVPKGQVPPIPTTTPNASNLAFIQK